MAVEILSFIRDIAEWLFVPVGRHLGYLVRYRRKIDKLKIEAESLEPMRRDVQADVDEANKNGEVIKSEVQTWLKRVDSITGTAQRLDDEGRVNKRCFNGWFPDCCWRYGLGKQAVEEMDTIGEVKRNKSFRTVSHPAPPPRITSNADFEAFESTKQAIGEIMEVLKKGKEVNIVGVYGMGGVGKTTIAKQVVNYVKDIFDQVVMGEVSQTPMLRKIQGQISDTLGLKLEDETEEGRGRRLKERIMRQKRILIILDDLWSWLDLSQVGIPCDSSELERCECKILLTTRQEHVCHTMKAQALIHVKLLSEEDSWTLFRRKAGLVVDSPSIYPLARRVARECGCLPISIVTVGRALADRDDLKEWKIAAQRLEKSKPANPNDEGQVFKCIKLSYDFLRGDDTKQCFLFCCLFPEDHDIEMEDLVKYGMGMGLFEDFGTMEEARGNAHVVLKHLVASSLLLDSDRIGCVKMHDVIRDIAILIASSSGKDEHVFMVQAGFGLKRWPDRDTFERYTAISLMSNEIRILPDGFEFPKLQALLLQDNTDLQEIPNSFFQTAITLRVLDLSGTQISSLPPSIGLLTNLQTLCLDRCQSTDISVLGDLKRLKVLSLRESSMEALPQKLGQLSNLRMLDLTMSCDIETIPPNVISGLYWLEELYMQGSFAQWGTNGSNFNEITSLPCLTTLKVDISDAECIPKNIRCVPNWVKFDICISEDSFTRLMNVHLSTTQSKGLVLDRAIRTLPDWFNEAVSKKVEKLIYSQCIGLYNILVEYDEGKLTGLKSLLVEVCYQIVYLMDARNWIPNRPVFESLEELRVHNMDYMKEICVGELPDGSLGNLKLLEVQQCNELVNALLPFNLLQRLQNLEILNVSGNFLKEVFQFQGEFYLRRLREVKLDNLPELTNIWNGPARLAIFHNLKVITVIKCKKLRNLFSSTISRGLLQLELLWIEDCHALEVIVGKDEEEAINFPNLKTLFLQYLPNLTSFYAGITTPIEFPSLEQLHVQDCPNFRAWTSHFHNNKQVQVNNEQHFNLLRNRLWKLK